MFNSLFLNNDFGPQIFCTNGFSAKMEICHWINFGLKITLVEL